MTLESKLESILNFELIEELEIFFSSKNRPEVIESLLVSSEKIFKMLSEESELLQKSYIWVGLSNYQDKPVIKLKILKDANYVALHELYRTDANILIGPAKYNSSSNTFVKTPDSHFFVESWEGSMSGSFEPFQILEDTFRYKKVS